MASPVCYKPSYTSIKDFSPTAIDTEHTICGWVRNTRIQAKIAFIEVYDGSSAHTLQCISEDDDIIAQLRALSVGAAVSFSGKLVKSPNVKQAFEFRIAAVKFIGPIADPVTYLLSAKSLTLDTLRENQHLRAKTRTFNNVFRIRAGLTKATHDFFHTKGFYHLNPNIITTSDCEGAGEVFTITNLFKQKQSEWLTAGGAGGAGGAAIDFSKDFFEKQAFLTVSSQLQLELLCAGLGKVWTSNKSFRAEHSKSNRHLAEFEHIEWEFAWVDLNDLMNFSEEYTQYCFNYVLTHFADELAELDKFASKGIIAKLRGFVSAPYARITYDDAIGMVEKHGADIVKTYGLAADLPKWGDDLGSMCEKYIADKLIGRPTFVYNYPKDLKSFYMKQNADGRTVQACDLLIPGLGELIGSSVREESYTKLLEVMEERKMDAAKLDWYLEMRKNGTFPHAGAGLGFDRLVSICCLMEGNIRDVVPFPVSYQECRF